MTAVDYLFLGILVLSAAAGLWRGFLKEACGLVTWIIAFWAAWRFGSVVEPHLGGLLVDDPFRTWAGRVIVFVIVLVIGAIAGALLAHLANLALLRAMDRALGFLFGTLRGIVLLGLLVVLGQAARLHTEDWWRHSRLIPMVMPVAKTLHALGGDHLRGAD